MDHRMPHENFIGAGGDIRNFKTAVPICDGEIWAVRYKTPNSPCRRESRTA
jgi:hypothetical protein